MVRQLDLPQCVAFRGGVIEWGLNGNLIPQGWQEAVCLSVCLSSHYSGRKVYSALDLQHSDQWVSMCRGWGGASIGPISHHTSTGRTRGRQGRSAALRLVSCTFRGLYSPQG